MYKPNPAALTSLLILALLFSACGPQTPVVPTLRVSGKNPSDTLPISHQPGGIQPAVFVTDQPFDGKTVLVPRVISQQQGWITIHNQQNGTIGPVIGYSPVSSGVNYNVTVDVDPQQVTSILYAELHSDVGVRGKYEFPGPDQPVYSNGILLAPPFKAIPARPLIPQIAARDQNVSGGKVQVDRVVSVGPGFIVIRSMLPGGQPGDIIGLRSVPDGSDGIVEVSIDPSKATPLLLAMLYIDSDEIGAFNPGSDQPAELNNQPVAAKFRNLAISAPSATPVLTSTATQVPTSPTPAQPAAASPVPPKAAPITATVTSIPTATDTPAATATTAATPTAVSVPSSPTPALQGVGWSVQISVPYSQDDLNNFNTLIHAYETQTGVRIKVTQATRDLIASLSAPLPNGSAMLPGESAPDLALVPNPSALAQLAAMGSIKPLDGVLDQNALRQQYDPGYLQAGSVGGALYGIFVKTSVKSLVWYDPKVFQAHGYQPPHTWQDLQALEQRILQDHGRPWCIGVSGGAGTGWPGTDWVEDLLLHQSGPQVYDRWVAHQIPWTDPAVQQAWQTWGSIVNDPQQVFGGATTADQTNFSHAFNPMFLTPTGCYLHKQADFITGYFTMQFPNLVAGSDYAFFPLPAPNPRYQNTLEVSGDALVMLHDTPQARALLQYLASAKAQAQWTALGSYIAPNKQVDPAPYPDDVSRAVAKLLYASGAATGASTGAVRLDASDQMPPALEEAFSLGVLIFAGHPGQLTDILNNIEIKAQSAYP